MALGTITSFVALRDSVEDSVTDAEAEIVQSELRSTINTVKDADTASATANLPGSIGGETYTASISDEYLVVSSSDESFRYSSGQLGQAYDLSGSAPGGAVTVSKTGNSIRLASGR